MARVKLGFHTIMVVGLCLLPFCAGTATMATIVGWPTVNLPGSMAATLTGITILYDEPDFLKVNKPIDAYLGIPFAEPPVGDLRFEDPVPYKIQGNYNATFDRDICPQISPLGSLPGPISDLGRQVSEDCLYLSIYAPSPKPSTPTPVMVWIHGGAYAIGAGSAPSWEALPTVALSDIIVVSINYRLGVFGFLTTGDDVAMGNYGMMDQVLALQWIQNNIAAFGGDPQKVTIAGESAGAASVGQHMLSPLSHGLFQQAIMESGNAACPWSYATMERAAVAHKELASLVGCPTSDTQAMFDCMRVADADLLITQQVLMDDSSMISRPVIDGDFMPEDPVEMIKRRKFQALPSLMGSNEDESAWTTMLLDFPFSLLEPSSINISRFRYLIPETLVGVETPEEKDAVMHQYIDWSIADNATANQVDGYVRMDSDQTFACPTEYYARALEAAGAEVYRYEMTHDPAWSVYVGVPTWIGAAHLEDVQFVFAWGLNPTIGRYVGQTDEEKAMSIEFMRYWTNFVKSGNPNKPMTSLTYPVWPRFTMPEQQYKKLSLNMTNGRAMRAADCTFWLNYLPKLRIQTDPIEDVYDDWTKQYEIWRDTDMPKWATEFDKYKEENTCPTPTP